jgi:hypothetical protein
MGWDDIYDPETFDDMLLLLAIPGLSIALTLLAVMVRKLYKLRSTINPLKDDIKSTDDAMGEAWNSTPPACTNVNLFGR